MFKRSRVRVSLPEPETSGWQKGAGCRGGWQVCALLVAGLLTTALAAHVVKSHTEKVERREFNLVCNEIRTTILARPDAQPQILRSRAAFYENADGVDRAKWHCYTECRSGESIPTYAVPALI